MGKATAREVAKVGARGVITIPASLRKAINVHPGDVVVIEASEEWERVDHPSPADRGQVPGLVLVGKLAEERDGSRAGHLRR